MTTRPRDTIRLVAEVLAGLSVQRSLPMAKDLLGTALEPWDVLRTKEHLNMFGWPDADAYEAALRKVLMPNSGAGRFTHGTRDGAGKLNWIQRSKDHHELWQGDRWLLGEVLRCDVVHSYMQGSTTKQLPWHHTSARGEGHSSSLRGAKLSCEAEVMP